MAGLDCEEMVECVSVLEFMENVAEYGEEPGERVVRAGVHRNTFIRDDEERDFVKIADAVAIIELHQPIPEDEVTEWCNSTAGKLALAHWFDVTDVEEVASP